MTPRQKKALQMALDKLVDVREAIEEGTWSNPDDPWFCDLREVITRLRIELSVE